MWAISCEMTSATRSSSRRDARSGSTSSTASRKVTQPRFSIAPKAKSGMATRSSFSAGYSMPNQSTKNSSECAAASRAKAVRSPLPGTWTMRTGVPRTSTGSVATSRSDDEGHEVGGHRDGVAEPDPPAALGERGVVDLGSVGIRRQPVGDVQGHREHRLAVGLVEARKGSPGVGGLELGGGDGVRDALVVGEGRAVEAVQLVIEDARELDRDHPRSRRERRLGAEDESLGARVHLDAQRLSLAPARFDPGVGRRSARRRAARWCSRPRAPGPRCAPRR